MAGSPVLASGPLASAGDPPDAPGPRPLLHRVAAGDRAAVAECVGLFGGLVWSLARRLSPTQAEAEDAVQEIFIDLWRSAGRHDPALLSEAAFVAMIARRRLIDRRRSKQRRPEETSIEGVDAAAPEGHPEQAAEAAMALKALDGLRPEQREILVMSAVQGLSHEEIAREKSMPLGTVKAHARRALLRVRAVLFGTKEEAP